MKIWKMNPRSFKDFNQVENIGFCRASIATSKRHFWCPESGFWFLICAFWVVFAGILAEFCQGYGKVLGLKSCQKSDVITRRQGNSLRWCTRVRSIISWTGNIEAGSINCHLLTNMDLYPTIMALTNGPTPENRIAGHYSNSRELHRQSHFVYKSDPKI